MHSFTKFILTSLLLGLVYSDSEPVLVPVYEGCPSDFGTTCNLQCPNGNYLLDDKGCPTCACATICQEIKCRANCGDAGYELDENGCQTCKCISKQKVECSRVICRMFCQYGFKRDENGCEYCACNQLPQPCPQLNCDQSCSKGYQKDYSGCDRCECQCPVLDCPNSIDTCKKGLKKDADGCQTCACEDEPKSEDKCLPIVCNLQCQNGFQQDELGCQICSCNLCPARKCRMYCMYGFRKNDDGCEICECDWTPVSEKIQCDERIACPGTRVCNRNLRLCETVNPDRISWFVYDFEVQSEVFKDDKFIQMFKIGVINNIAAKYDFDRSQITVSSVEQNGLTSFQIMPFFTENMEIFEAKIDQIDIDLNSHEFRTVLPAVALAIEDGNSKKPARIDLGRWCGKLKNLLRSKVTLFTLAILLTFTVIILIIVHIKIYRRRGRVPLRSESKTPIYDTSYQLAPTDEEHYQAVRAPDGTSYLVVASDGTYSSNDKPALV